MPLTSPFRDASDLLHPNPADSTYGCAMVDLERSGRPQILVVTVAGPNHLYRWEAGRLVDVAPPILQDSENSGIGVACADLTGNGFPDIYLLNTSAFLGPDSDPDLLLANEGGLRFRNLLGRGSVNNFGAGRSVVWWDFGGVGRPGVYVCNYAEPCRLFAMLTGGRLANVAPEMGLNQITGGRSAVAADFFDTGRLDLFTANENDRNRFFRNLGSGRFQECAVELGVHDPREHARGVAVGDLDRDGRLDLVCANWEGPHRIFMQQADGRFRDMARPPFSRPSRARTVIVFDYDNDGWDDIFINNIGEPNRLFHNNGDGIFEEVEAGDHSLPDGFGTGATVGDIDGDGFLDLFVSHGESVPMPNALLRNTPNGNHWLRVHVRTEAGAPAVGARVRVWPEGDDRPITRFIDGGSGYLCQMEPVAHVGLGRAAGAARIEVRLSDGRVHELRDVEGDRNLIVQPEGEGWRVAE